MRQDSVPNHTIDPATGFTESLAYAYAFDAQKKRQFLDLYRANELALYETCAQLGLSHHTVLKHYRNDPAFKAAFDDVEQRYTDELEAISRRNARDPKFYVERIFQLKALRPDKYADQNRQHSGQIVVNIGDSAIESSRMRQNAIDAEIRHELSNGESAKIDGREPITVDVKPLDAPNA